MLESLSLNELLKREGIACSCGRTHKADLEEVYLGKGVLAKLPEICARRGLKRAYLLADKNTYPAAGERVKEILEGAGVECIFYIFPQERVVPDEQAVGQAVMDMPRCDVLISVGSGTINDIGKIAARTAGVTMMNVSTAPSMDGFASDTSSMISAGVKRSVPSGCPHIIVADTDILTKAPLIMMQSGLGDMIAKYVSLVEWKISNKINGEYYCDEIAALVQRSLDKCVQAAHGILRGEEDAIASITEGLILSGIAMSFAKLSRPASGFEHYVSHMWDMRAINEGTAEGLHGIQVGIGTMISLHMYEWLLEEVTSVDIEKAMAHAKAHDKALWQENCRRRFGKGASAIIALEEKEGKYAPEGHARRLAYIAPHWDELREIMKELPSSEDIRTLLTSVGAPTKPADIGITEEGTREAVLGTGDIRDKYVLSRLLWDLGMLDEYAERAAKL